MEAELLAVAHRNWQNAKGLWDRRHTWDAYVSVRDGITEQEAAARRIAGEDQSDEMQRDRLGRMGMENAQ